MEVFEGTVEGWIRDNIVTDIPFTEAEKLQKVMSAVDYFEDELTEYSSHFPSSYSGELHNFQLKLEIEGQFGPRMPRGFSRNYANNRRRQRIEKRGDTHLIEVKTIQLQNIYPRKIFKRGDLVNYIDRAKILRKLQYNQYLRNGDKFYLDYKIVYKKAPKVSRGTRDRSRSPRGSRQTRRYNLKCKSNINARRLCKKNKRYP